MIQASIIIPTKNAHNLFKKVLNAVLKQELKEKYEVIIIDSGSTDNTISHIKDQQIYHDNIKLHQIDASEFGHGKTRNLGASLAKGEFLVFITQDALPYDNYWLQEILKPFKLSSDIMGVFSKHLPYLNCDTLEQENLKKHFEMFGYRTKVFKMDDKKRYNQDINFKMSLCFYSDNSSAMRKIIWEKIPYDDVDFAEDQLWAKKILEAGYSKVYAPNSIVFHSHNYSFKELFMRSYDEYIGLYDIYEYIPIKNGVLLPLYILKRTINEMHNLHTLKIGIREKISLAFLSLGKNTCKLTGAYLGVRAKRRGVINSALSREHSIKGIK